MGASGRSYVVGFGPNPPTQPHHRDSTLSLADSGSWYKFMSRLINANQLTGALVGGPNMLDEWQDDRNDHNMNEVALDFNAALLLAVIQCST